MARQAIQSSTIFGGSLTNFNSLCLKILHAILNISKYFIENVLHVNYFIFDIETIGVPKIGKNKNMYLAYPDSQPKKKKLGYPFIYLGEITIFYHQNLGFL